MVVHVFHVCICLLICMSLDMLVCVCVSVCLYKYSAFCIQERSKLDTGPNTLRRCLFNHNLGLHENANQKQTGLPGKLDREKGEEERERGGGRDEWGGIRGMGGCEQRKRRESKPE